MIRDAPNINYLFAGLLVEELVRHGVEWFVISPGSRSAPLAWTAASHPRAKTVVHFDERGAAFHALGIAKATLKPAAFICTSGTATANALPAAIEASYSGIPLILITADRPERLQGSGANQTINQHGLYREFVRDEKNFAVDADDFDAAAVLAAIDEALYSATAAWPGPVHLNCQFDEPLAPVAASTGVSDALWSQVSSWVDRASPFTESRTVSANDSREALSRLADLVARREPGLIIVGQLSGPKERDEVYTLLQDLEWPYIADITSGLRLGSPLPWALSFANHYATDAFGQTRTLIHLGGPVTSRRLLDPMSNFDTSDRRREFIRVSANPARLDPYSNLTLRVHATPAALSETLSVAAKSSSRTQSISDRDRRIYDLLCDSFAPGDRVTEIGVTLALTFEPPRRAALFAGNSMPIRDLDAYGVFNLNHATWVVANRGASGIDGNIATAAGHVRATGEPLIALLGDLAVMHDLNSLALLRELPAPLVIVALNNDGGGIFSFLPIGTHAEHFERLFGTPHGFGFSKAAEMFGLDYSCPETNMEIDVCAREAIDRNRSCIIEVRTDRAENLRLHRELDARIRAALASPASPPS